MEVSPGPPICEKEFTLPLPPSLKGGTGETAL